MNAVRTRHYTKPIPKELFEPVSHRGKVMALPYGEGRKAKVYLPWGYDESKEPYDVLYLVHGWCATAGDYFGDCPLADLLDGMIEQKLIRSLVVVSPVFDPAAGPGEPTRFHEELERELIPTVEGAFRVSARREDQAVGGFSLGGVAAWDIFVHSLDRFRYFLPMSGDCWAVERYGGYYRPEETAALLAERAKGQDFLICAAVGGQDPLFDQMDRQITAMREFTDCFTSKNLRYQIKKDGFHDLDAVLEYLYNALPFFFGRNAG